MHNSRSKNNTRSAFTHQSNRTFGRDAYDTSDRRADPDRSERRMHHGSSHRHDRRDDRREDDRSYTGDRSSYHPKSRRGDKEDSTFGGVRNHRHGSVISGGSDMSTTKWTNSTVVLKRSNRKGVVERAELSVPATKSTRVLNMVYKQIISKFGLPGLHSIRCYDRNSRASVFVANYLHKLLQEEQRNMRISHDSMPSESHSRSNSYYDSDYSDESEEQRINWVTKVIEVPKIEVVEKKVEVPQVQEVVKVVTVKEVKEVEVPVYKEVIKKEIREVYTEVQVPGKIVEVPVDVIVEKEVVNLRITDHKVPISVSTIVEPVMELQSKNPITISSVCLEPVIKIVDIMVPVPVEVPIDGPFKLAPVHKKVDWENLDLTKVNSVCLALNKHLLSEEVLEKMKDYENTVNKVNSNIDEDMIEVRHADSDKTISNVIPFFKEDIKHPGRIPMSSDATTSPPKGAILNELMEPGLAGILQHKTY